MDFLLFVFFVYCVFWIVGKNIIVYKNLRILKVRKIDIRRYFVEFVGFVILFVELLCILIG